MRLSRHNFVAQTSLPHPAPYSHATTLCLSLIFPFNRQPYSCHLPAAPLGPRPVRLTAGYQSYAGHGELEIAASPPPSAPWRVLRSRDPWSSTRCTAMAGLASDEDAYRCAAYRPEVPPSSPRRPPAAARCRRNSRRSAR